MPRRARRTSTLPRGFWLIWTTVALDLVGFGIVVPVLAQFSEDGELGFGASKFQAALLLSAFSAAQFVCAPLLGRLSDRIGRKPVILISLFGTALGSFMTGAARALWVLFAARILDGASGASVSVAQGAVSDVVEPEDRPRALGLLAAAFGVGFVVGPMLGGLAHFLGVRAPFYVAGGIALINGLIAIRRLPETLPPERRAAARLARQDTPKLRYDARLWRYAAVGFCGIASFAGFEATFSLLTKDRFDLGVRGTFGLLAAAGVFLVLVQSSFIRPVGARLGAQRSMVAGLAMAGFGLLGVGASAVGGDGSWWIALPSMAVLTLGQGLVFPNLTAMVAEHAPVERRGQALGFQQSANSLARIAGPALAGWFYGHMSVPAPYLFTGALSLFAVAMAAPGNSPRPEVGTGGDLLATPHG